MESLPCEERFSIAESLDILRETYHYNHWVYDVARDHLGSSLVEVGAGIGNITRFLLHHDRVVCVETDPGYMRQLQALRRKHRVLEVVHDDFIRYSERPEALGAFDSALCINVLEHIDDDLGFLRAMLRTVRSGGNVVLFVPAWQFAYGPIDRRLGHRRRYGKARLVRLAEQSGASVRVLRHFNFVGLFGWFLENRIRGTDRIDARKARGFNRMVPYLSALERLIPPPLGQSLFMVLEKP
ncbi:MAG: class I SAM-dependent methyltransferase [Deltaproteobacteria bacterium]|nr:class I SAM-dependent methyltransferase [Deltaproteobacteria bacterium]